MSGNHEERIVQKEVHIFLAVKKESAIRDKECIRQVIKQYTRDLMILAGKCLALGGVWRIYRTVNARDCEKARIWLIHRLIDFPEKASYVDSEWRTALLQPEHKVTKYFMLDVDTQEESAIAQLETAIQMLKVEVLVRIKSPKGWHYIIEPRDVRELIKLGNITLLRDGYFYIQTVGKENE